MQLYRATLLHTRATKLREKIAGVTSVYRSSGPRLPRLTHVIQRRLNVHAARYRKQECTALTRREINHKEK